MSGNLDEQVVLRMESADRAALERIAQSQHRKLANLTRCILKDFIEASHEAEAAQAKKGRAA
ncbi:MULTISPECIES: hypothetical protein [unclassified Bradyrhizobium]|uniref:hypothetical protein n=1 Tax=unclassified Bradyrhizobium TaxID=2631580 RepID=UPI001FF79FE0|nr:MULTISPECIES: hypothetical protein [unclassified Bradyrhizobium]MCK1707624.1 hypothetical protein [Bradyrhizobium sp. 143]MCK1724835.1 hypothetical protein [Bradyrhizobium sp. 142]